MIETREVLLRLNMTSNTAPAPFRASHSSNWTTSFAAWFAFNGNVNIGASETGWRSNNSSINEWLQIELNTERTLASYSIHRASLTANNAPVNFTFSGSNDGTNWNEIDTQSGIAWDVGITVQRFNLSSPATFRFFRLSVVKATASATVGIGQLDFTEIRPVEWFLNSDFNIEGYPHPVILLENQSGEEELVSLELSMKPFQFNWSGETLGWKFEDSILNGYPHIQYRALVAPELPASITSIELGHNRHFEGLESDLLVELIIRHLQTTDTIVMEIRNSSDLLVWSNEFSSFEARQQTITHAIPSTILENLSVDTYTVSALIKRGAVLSPTVSDVFEVIAVPFVEVISLSPPLIALPAFLGNNQTSIGYAVNGQGLESVINTFTIADNMVSETLYAAEFLEIEATTPTSAIWNANFNFQISDPDFRLISLRFRFGQHNSSTEVRYNINNTNVMIVPRPANAPTEWIEWVAPEPMHLPMGANTIQVTNDFGNFVMFSTTNRPTTPGMEITSTTVWAMEMVYSVSTSGIESGKVQTATLFIGDDTALGNHPLSVESKMVLDGFGSHIIESNTNFILQVVITPVLENISVNPSELTTLSPPTDIETNWRLVAEFLEGEAFSVTGEIYIGGTNFITDVDTNALEFAASFSDIVLPVGNHSFGYALVISHNKFGNIPISGKIDNALYVELVLPPPQILAVELSHSGRFVGAEIGIGVIVTMADIAGGDEIEIIFHGSAGTIFSYIGLLGEGETSHSHTIPAEYFIGLSPGKHDIVIKLVRNSLVASVVYTIPYEVIQSPSVGLNSVTPDVFQLPTEPNTSISTVWQVAMHEGSEISGKVGIVDSVHYGEIAPTASEGFTIQILKVSPISEGIHSLEYDFIVSHETFGEVNITGIVANKIFIAPALVIAETHSSINAFATFSDIMDVSIGSHPISAEIIIHSYQYGSAVININTPDVLTIAYIVPEIGKVELDFEGRFSGSEVAVTVTASDMENIESAHTVRIDLHRNNTVFYSFDTSLNSGDETFTHTIPASAFVTAFASLGHGEYFVRLQILRNSEVAVTEETSYRIVKPPTMALANISHPTIQLPLFSPINLIASFVAINNPGINSISGTITLGTLSGSNASSDPEGLVSIAIMNIAAIAQGSYSLSATFEIVSKYGTISIAQSFPNVITVFPNIQTDGVDTKYEYDLILCMPNRTEQAFIEAYDVVWNPMFLQYNQLNFSIYREIVTEDNTKYINPVWEKILSDALVLMQIRINELVIYKEYFVIENPAISYSGLDELSFQANSWEILFLNNLDLSGWRDSVKRLYDPTNRIGDDGLPHGILNYILKMKWNNVWTLRHVDSTVLERERVLSFTGNNMSFVVDTLEESFHCVFVFDNVNLTLDIFEREIGMLGSNRGLVVADDTYATSIKYNEDTSGIKTRIFVYGKNQATIARYNPTGQLYVDDFSFYMTTQYMTQELIDALSAYKNLVRSQYGVWESLVDQMDAFLENSPDAPLPADLLQQMNAIIALLAWENNFTMEQIKQIASFIKEETVNINTIEDGRELYRFALRHIKTTAFVPIHISIDCIDVLALEEHQREWLKFRVGDFANIYREEFGLAYKEMRLISYEHNPIQNSLRLEFSNRDELVTMQWLNNMFFYRLGNLENTWNNERDWYIRIPEFDFNSPELLNLIQNIVEIEVDNSLEVIFKEIDERVFNQIVEVFETEVLAADTAHILNAWIRFLKVDMLETNFEALDPRIAWPPGTEPFVRYFIRIAGITMQHIRAALSPTEIENYRTPSYRLPDGSMSPGDQIFWTAIGDHPQAFKYFTITDPISVFVNGTITVAGGDVITVTNRRVLTNPLPPGVEPPDDYEEVWRDLTPSEQEQVREMFRVKVRRTLSESVRKTDAFEYINNPGSGGGRTMIPKTIWGGGNHVDPNLTNGRGYQYKDWDSFNMTYTTRTGYGNVPAGTEIGIRLQDDGCYYFDMEENEWLKIGSGGKLCEDELRELIEVILHEFFGDINIDGNHIIMPRLPVQAEIDLMPINSVVLVYDPDTPFIPAS